MMEKPESFLRDKSVLLRMPISRAALGRGVKEGRYPVGIKLSARIAVRKFSDSDRLIHTLASR